MPTTIPLGINKRTNEPFTVMIVDDTISIRILLKRLLIRKEFRVISEAQNGQIALDELELLNIKPDIIFIDQEMPEMDGLSAIQEIRPKYPNIKIIMFTSHAEKPLVQEILNLKVNAYIVKPFEEHKVIEKLAHLRTAPKVMPRSRCLRSRMVKTITGSRNSVAPAATAGQS